MIPDFTLGSLEEKAFSFRAALSLAMASELVYVDDVAHLAQTFSTWGLTLHEFYNEPVRDSQAAVCSGGNVIIVVFRGTEGLRKLRDWLQNLKITRERNTLGGRSHFGFGEALRAVWLPGILPLLLSLGAPQKKVYFTGHSLGGALALLAGAAWYTHQAPYLTPAGIYTYGQPLVGSRLFVAAVNEALGGVYHRFVNHRDLVTRVPPWPRFRHAGNLYRFDAEGHLGALFPESEAVAASEPEALSEVEFALLQQALEDQQRAELLGIPPMEEGALPRLLGIEDHAMAHYIRHIRRLAGDEEFGGGAE